VLDRLVRRNRGRSICFEITTSDNPDRASVHGNARARWCRFALDDSAAAIRRLHIKNLPVGLKIDGGRARDR
jgi:hypothetical protein